MIKSMKVTKAGSFDRYAKVISSEDMNNLADKIENKIKQALKEISECKFDITPKIIKSKDVSCAFCDISVLKGFVVNNQVFDITLQLCNCKVAFMVLTLQTL